MPQATNSGNNVPQEPYYTFGYSINDARKHILVHPPMDEDAHAGEAGNTLSCGTDDWNGLQAVPDFPSSSAASSARQLPAPLPCGLLWYTHISKTGGETVRHHLKARVRKHGWSFLDLYTSTSPRSMRRAGRWEIERHIHALAVHLNRSRPRLVVHQHDGVGGLGEYFLERVLKPLSCRFQTEAPECKVVLVTTLRDPVGRLVSQAQSDKLPPAQFNAFARAQANFQTKYVLFTTDWRVSSLFLSNSRDEQALLQPARDVLSHATLVGRTEELRRFLVALDATMGWTEEDFSSDRSTLHEGHRSKMRWNLTRAQAVYARRFNAVDAELYTSFCRPNAVGSSKSRHVRPLCSATPVVHGLPHYYTAHDVSKQPPLPEDWQLVFDGRACHGFHLGDEYTMRCTAEVEATLGRTFGKITAFHRERSGKLLPCSDARVPKKSQSCMGAH
jgi:hypothetical protein